MHKSTWKTLKNKWPAKHFKQKNHCFELQTRNFYENCN